MDETRTPATPLDPAQLRAELDRLVVRRQTDLQRLWELLMSPLGFSRRALWMTVVDRSGRPLPQLVEVEELPDGEAAREVHGLFHVLVGALGNDRHHLGVAFLVVRPGRAQLHEDDRRLAAALLEGARAAGLVCHPVHVAGDDRVLPVTPDDLAA